MSGFICFFGPLIKIHVAVRSANLDLGRSSGRFLFVACNVAEGGGYNWEVRELAAVYMCHIKD